MLKNKHERGDIKQPVQRQARLKKKRKKKSSPQIKITTEDQDEKQCKEHKRPIRWDFMIPGFIPSLLHSEDDLIKKDSGQLSSTRIRYVLCYHNHS